MKKKSNFILLTFLLLSALKIYSQGIIFPRAFSIAIDDMGWNNGSDLSANQGPWRDGVNKHMTINDYMAVVNVGKSVGVRIQGLFVMCEMDRQNICAKYPTTTMYGKDWDNSANVTDEQIDIMNYVRDNSANLEFGMHGVGHEYWPAEKQRARAEWFNITGKQPWPEDSLRKHIKCFQQIMAQYGLTPENGHSFPESFVPGMYAYYWNPEGNYSLGSILNEAGVKYANASLQWAKDNTGQSTIPAGNNAGGFDHTILLVNRTNYGNSWDQFASLPSTSINNQYNDIIESHWPNWQSANSANQASVTQNWINYYKSVQQKPDRYIAKNTEQLYSQWLYNKYTSVKEDVKGTVTINNTAMPDQAYVNNLPGNMVLKVKIETGSHISSALLDSTTIASYFEDEGYAFMYLPPLQKKSYTLKYIISENVMPEYIFNSGTYNVYKTTISDTTYQFDIKMYGTQVVKIKTSNPKNITTSNPNLQIISNTYDSENGMLLLELKGRNMQGERGIISLETSNIIQSVKKTAQESLFIFPNPATDFLILRANDLAGKCKISITNVSGKCVYFKTIATRNNSINEKIDIRFLKSGQYFVKVDNKTGNQNGSVIIGQSHF